MTQTDRLTHRLGILRICTKLWNVVADYCSTNLPKQQVNPHVLCKTKLSHIGGPGGRFELYRWFCRSEGCVCLQPIKGKVGRRKKKRSPHLLYVGCAYPPVHVRCQCDACRGRSPEAWLMAGGKKQLCTPCCAIMFPGRKSALRAAFWLECYRQRTLMPAKGLPEDRTASSPVKVRPGWPICSQNHYCAT